MDRNRPHLTRQHTHTNTRIEVKVSLTRVVRAGRVPRQPLPNHPSKNPEGVRVGGGRGATPRSSEEMGDGQQQSVDVPARTGTTHDRLSQKKKRKKKKRLEEDLR